MLNFLLANTFMGPRATKYLLKKKRIEPILKILRIYKIINSLQYAFRKIESKTPAQLLFDVI